MRLEHNRIGNIHTKQCKQCGRLLNKYYKEDLCPSCIEINLFADVKEYIRSNSVKEMDVAQHFNIPLSKVKSWITDGRIEYRTKDGKTISGVRCQMCGKKISFGTVCPECHKLQQLQVIMAQHNIGKEEMRFLNDNRYGVKDKN